MQEFEKLGQFYFGRTYDLEQEKINPDLVLYDARDLCTHAVCVGMTGSGKTGLCLSLLEEAAIDGIPAIAIDPKGDLGNLMLTFPELQPAQFGEWVDPAEATRKGLTTDEYAKTMAETWRKGLADWGQDGERIRKFRESVDVAIYTPASNAGLPLTVLRSFTAPGQEVRDDSEALRERIMSAVSGLLALLQVNADPISSREHILLSNILDRAWRDGKDLDMAGLLRAIQAPGFEKVGFMDLESFFPAKDRFALAMQLNNLLASPGFSAWLEGDPLDVKRLLHTPEGKPRLAIISIAHLNDSERMFFVTILLNEILAWMRSQPGTSSLRALLYMDEVFGYFPPTANPPSKQPMLTLLKQARAFGLGCVLATQNPVDIDYKGLSNAGTWFLGRLQTERDKARVLDGLEGASATAGSIFDRQKMEQTLSGLGSRVFLMNNVHEDEPVVFHTRWVLSYLRGPLTRNQIQTLMAERKAELSSAAGAAGRRESIGDATEDGRQRPVVPPDIPESFLPARDEPDDDERLVYRPALVSTARAHFVRSKDDVDHWDELTLIRAAGGGLSDDVWDDADRWAGDELEFMDEPEPDAEFASLPPELTQARKYKSWGTALRNHVYREHTLNLWRCRDLKATSTPGESEGDFRVRLTTLAREQRDLRLEKLRKKYAPKLASMQERIRKAEQRVEREKQQQKEKSWGTAISIGTSVLGALFGRKLASSTNVTRAGSAMRSAGRVARERADVRQAEETVEAYLEKLETLEAEFNEEITELQSKFDPDIMSLEEESIRPRKSDLSVGRVALVWTPWIVGADGIAEPAY